MNIKDITEWFIAIEYLFNGKDEDEDTILGDIIENTHEMNMLRRENEALKIKLEYKTNE